MDLTEFGITKEDIIDAATDKLVSEILNENDGDQIYAALKEKGNKKVKQLVEQLGDDVVTPILIKQIEGLTFQRTDKWGNPTDEEPRTLAVFLGEQAEVFLSERVSSSSGEPVDKGNYSYKDAVTRLEYFIGTKFSEKLAGIAKDALNDVNGEVSAAIEATVKGILERAVKNFKIHVSV